MIKVLIVEDDPMVAQINKKYTESVDEFNVIGICNNGKDALEMIKNNNIDLIILDIYMPKLDGIGFLKEIRNSGISTDIIMVTAADESDKLNEVLKLGAIDYLIKPFEYERFKDALNKFKVRHKVLSQKSIISQDDIDRITNQSNFNINEDAQKGINDRTLKRLKDFLKDYSEECFTCEEIAEEMRLSRVTIRRYLEYMTSIGELNRDIEYGEIGRPKTIYKLL
ncbi:Transcriptional regulatory protein CitT [Clostridium liquoris]|jgi:response regulator of citrate/malate metabolism|uniref:Transcriptional regulatory protein n=1 Tax=Clostridium liquoris TaxID=1289519 RepID=A0A2T0B5H7_9CLOT|nr:response regulator [Clostridium liquoris]PRR79144.1 Transcriptional regulatory protein CitT [Clostridium liquoris]